MTFVQHFPCIKIVGSIFCIGIYIASFASKAWVVAADHTIEFGLWAWCYTNFTHQDNVSEHVNDTMRCRGIAPGDSPGYYEGVRTMACFALVGFLALLLTFDENKKDGWGVEKRPCIVAWVATLLSLITVGLLGDKYHGDERWKELDPQLGWCFWLAMSACILVCLLGALGWKYDEMKKSPPAATSTNSVAAGPAPPARPPPSVAVIDVRPGNQTTSSSSVSETDVSSRSTDDANNTKSKQRSIQVATNDHPNPTGRTSSGAEFPVYRLPRYEIPPEPGSQWPTSPPPSYEEAVSGRHDHGASPPQPVLVPESPVNQLNTDRR